MDRRLLIRIAEALLIPVIGFACLVLYSLALGWTLPSMILFWFLLLPAMAIFLPKFIVKRDIHLWQSILGLVLFYAFMVLMIYQHSESDFFILMMLSLFCNIAMASFMSLLAKSARIAKLAREQ